MSEVSGTNSSPSLPPEAVERTKRPSAWASSASTWVEVCGLWLGQAGVSEGRGRGEGGAREGRGVAAHVPRRP